MYFLTKISKRVANAVFVAMIFTLSLHTPLYSGDISDEIINNNHYNGGEKSQLNTQVGILFKSSYFPRNMEISSNNFASVSSIYLGGGLFFDYKLFPFLTLTVEGSKNFEMADFAESGDSWQWGLFAKHLLDDRWGYVGLGIDSYSTTTVLSTGAEVIENDFFLSVIITGENVGLKNKLNTTGNLRISISLSTDTKDTSPRFLFVYVLGLGFEIL